MAAGVLYAKIGASQTLTRQAGVLGISVPEPTTLLLVGSTMGGWGSLVALGSSA